ncbi:MAG: hypothetical protein N3C63_00890 [Rhodocyclaceae bacterium]|nr:hypothetical protein [Rhodocyclaceae bacterium]
MTYCLASNVNDGLVLCSDSRTNAGTDVVSTYSKMFIFVWPGARFFCLLSAGNLATTQAVVKKLNSDVPAWLVPNLSTVTTMHEAADGVGMSNVTVGPPSELLIYRRDSLDGGRRLFFREDDPYAKELSEKWNAGLIGALEALPLFEWERNAP